MNERRIGGSPLIITINRPEAKNAMNKEASELIAAALDRLDTENDLRVGIVTGAGGTFCSGMDLGGFCAVKPLRCRTRLWRHHPEIPGLRR